MSFSEVGPLFILLTCLLLGFIAIFFTSIGTMIMFLGILAYAFLTGFKNITIIWLGVLFGIYLTGELVEFLITILGAKSSVLPTARLWALGSAVF